MDTLLPTLSGLDRGNLNAGMVNSIQKTLRHVFGLRTLRIGQAEVVQRVLDGRNTLGVMPTGAGKSLCYQLPAVLLPGTTVVVSPLLALMKDQCDSLTARGIAAIQLNSALTSDEFRASMKALEDGAVKVLLTTPEQIADPELIHTLNKHKVSLLAVDEAHCVSQWGHDFRPAFLEIAPAARALGSPIVLALTATAKPEVSKEIVNLFSISPEDVVRRGAYRRNLDLAVEQLARAPDRLCRALQLVSKYSGSGIVYTSTIKAAEELRSKLALEGEQVGLYHGRMPAAERVRAQDAFMNGDVRVMVATNAFGLGIDKPDTRFVLHYQMPSSVDTYYQEAGRAGRDGKDAKCTLLYVRQDRSLQQFFKSGRYPALQDLKAIIDVLAKSPPNEGWTAETLLDAVDRPKAKTLVAINLLRSHRVVKRDRSGRLSLAKPGDDLTLEKMLAKYQKRRDQDNATLEAMVAYSQGGGCRWTAVLSGLGEDADFTTCGHCDNCRRLADLARRTPSSVQPERPIESRRGKEMFLPGAKVCARRYGEGVVTETTAQAVTLEFPNGVRRTFLPEFVRPAGRSRKSRGAPVITMNIPPAVDAAPKNMAAA